ncbi:hypothetical protein [Mesorhizobium sp.]|uniref:hypothetical protein n=1 Tax=Mesorhizobium sp. TaxID=1871066 RepID=UPI000FE9AAF7|nr:hypothetical protein [Mesorhizobium sp.]RWE95741.1 MAG: hypothetical protein EOS68_18800 [Mesorhizobium sp.]
MSDQVETPWSDAMEHVWHERCRQEHVEGWAPEHDDTHVKGELASAAITYALHAVVIAKCLQLGMSQAAIDSLSAEVPMPETWPWSPEWWKPKNQRADLVRAGALIVAEIERLDRLAAKVPE